MASFTARAPSNIALIKYMGKHDARRNLPANPSLSLTLHDLATFTEIRRVGTSARASLHWVQELPVVNFPKVFEARVPFFDLAATERATRHFQRLVENLPRIFSERGLHASVEDDFEIRTANTFPAATGIASSASGFAALTLAGAQALCTDPTAFVRLYRDDLSLRRELASLSRQGSGSSCRSFEGPWVLWQDADAAAMSTAMPELTDLVLLIGREAKTVSSTEAHSRVLTSPLWERRTARVAHRVASIGAALAEGNGLEVSRIAWAESFEMHSLFHTSAQPFTYWEPGSIAALRWLNDFVATGSSAAKRPHAPPPIVTLDAGPNVHLLVPSIDAQDWRMAITKRFPELEVLTDRQGAGAEIL